ncbi:hypothetical protein HEP86_13645 [Streptomyces sp. RPA4-5]|uniref:hypothetical protein n=1 Tax=Streptomyces sp. RPA4-5 TaxID=2721245 RepID=UPI00143E711E|nr:hypothetical protein [Streptomyces sp. RPA4-5]QIY55391.1 hypothetical protein HEP86_13645 [Streptomyces sp. RPA4-5]
MSADIVDSADHIPGEPRTAGLLREGITSRPVVAENGISIPRPVPGTAGNT